MSLTLNRSVIITVRISLALLLLQCVLYYVVFQNFRSAVSGNVKKQQAALVTTLAHEVDDKIAQHLRLLGGIAEVVPGEAMGDPAAAQAFLALHREAGSAFDHGLLLLDRNGTLLAQYPAGSGPAAPYLKRLGATRIPTVSLPSAPGAKDPFVLFAVPVVGRDGAVRGVLAGTLGLLHDNFLSSIAEAKVGASGHLYLFGRDRTIIVHPERSRIMKADVAVGSNRLFDRAIAGFEGSGETVNSKGIETVSSFKALHNAPWILAANFPVQEAYAPLKGALIRLLLALSCTVIGSCLALHLIACRMKREVARRNEAEDQASLLLASVDEGVLAIDAAGIVYFANKTALALLGYHAPEELVGQDARTLLHASAPDCPNCERSQCRIFAGCLDGGSVRSENETILCRDGSPLHVDFSSRPVWDGPDLKGAVLTFRDVSDQKQARERLRVQGAALEAAASSILITDGTHRIVWANRAFTVQTGYSLEEALGREPIALLAGAWDDALFRNLRETLERNEPWHGELVSCRKDGSLYNEEVSITPVLDEAGVATHFIGIMQDVSQRKRSEAELRDSNLALEEANRKLRVAMERANEMAHKAECANAAKSEFLANMSHEIRTPMNAIVGVGHLLQQTRLSEKQQEFLQTLTVSAEALLAIINDILDLSKIEAGKLSVERVGFQVQQVVEDMLIQVRRKAVEKGLKLSCDLDAALPPCLVGDPLHLGQILNNLLTNALKFTSAGEIALLVRVLRRTQEGVELEFSVRDTGIGIREQDQSRLFQPFTQVDGSVTRNYGGTGLGLAICKQLSTLMGGEIWCHSTPGLGSTFFVTLPFGVAAEAEGGEQRKPQAPARFDGESVLVVEDNVFNQQVAVALLENVGLRVTVAANGLEALQLVGREDFDVVLMDIQMPVMDGLTASREIRKLGKGASELPIVAVSANASDEDIRESISAGMNGYLTKPYTPESLYGTIYRRLADKRTRQEARLDVDRAVRQIGGDRKLYCNLLARFLEEYAGKGAELRADVAVGNLQRASHLAHAIKGVAGVLAAHDLREAAQELEGALKRGNTELDPHLSRFDAELAATLERIRTELRLQKKIDTTEL